MYEEDKTPNEIHEEKPMDITSDEKKITVKKSTYNNMLKGLVVAIAVAAFFGGLSIGTFDKSDSGLSGEELKDILSEIEITTTAPQPALQPSRPSAPQTIAVSLDDDPIKGNANAPVTVIEFSDFQCPFCSRFYTQTLSQLQEDYIDTGKIKLVFRDLPLDSLHPNARLAHVAAECADEEGKFWEYHDVLFEKQSQWQRLPPSDYLNSLIQYADDLGLQTVSFESCLESQEMFDEVARDVLEAARYGATGTPTFFIGNEEDGFVKLVGAQPFSVFQQQIDSRLES